MLVPSPISTSSSNGGTPLPARQFAAVDKQSSVWPVIESFMTDHDSTQFISAVKTGAGYSSGGDRDVRCKSTLFLGEWLAFRKGIDSARPMFTGAVALCRPLSIEHATATAEIQRTTH